MKSFGRLITLGAMLALLNGCSASNTTETSMLSDDGKSACENADFLALFENCAADAKGQITIEPLQDTEPRRFCYTTLGDVDCYDEELPGRHDWLG